MVTEVRLLHPLKAMLPTVVTLLGILIDVSPLQLSNAPVSIFSILLGMVIEVRPLQPQNVYSAMFGTPSGMVTDTRFLEL